MVAKRATFNLVEAYQIKIHLYLCLSSEEHQFFTWWFCCIDQCSQSQTCLLSSWLQYPVSLHNLQSLESMHLPKIRYWAVWVHDRHRLFLTLTKGIDHRMSFIHPPLVSFFCWTQKKIFWSCYRYSVLLTKQLTVATSIKNTVDISGYLELFGIEVSGYNQLFGYQHPSKYFLLCSTEEEGLEQLESE